MPITSETDLIALQHAARAQHAGTLPGIPPVPAVPTIINQQVQSRSAAGDGVDERYVDLYREKITLETQLRIAQGEIEAIKRERDSIKGDLKAVTTSGRSMETKAFNALKEDKRALENMIEEQERNHRAERLEWQAERQQLKADLDLYHTAFESALLPPARRASSTVGNVSIEAL
ncbi:unnamed protein product [Tilletia laevis]|uniref:Uncharacterized protein n=2 Tax=Tilletia TaxID=13289 RepID=A0A177T2D3_9BASI|nr:hypothetical protein CF335_g8777 [Tilletia laevis]KAE8238549.1 hypothetical protein A4X03_0g8836 [Tilletia caries]CAD6931214.1 unnamed protein product [Tilletia caries]CAD6943171.1 unnamed protein product [Tilletia laevis]CAD6960976.1 unnamed protein product [Tilletia caries]